MYTFTIEYSLRNGVNTRNRPLPCDVNHESPKSKKCFKHIISLNKLHR